jgi:hypothetical protein
VIATRHGAVPFAIGNVPLRGIMVPVARAVFIFEGNDLQVHPSLQRAADAVEPIDVENGEFDFFAEDGTVLVGETPPEGRVVLRPTPERRPDELRERLRRYLSHPGVALDQSLADDPIALAQAVLDREWEQRWFKWFPWLDRRLHGDRRHVV